MSIEDIRAYYLELPHATECFPFDEHTLVVKVGSKMFALLSLEGEGYLCLKCDPERSLWLQEHYSAIEGAYHMNKRHWIGIYYQRGIEPELIRELILHSYTLVWAKLSQREQQALSNPLTI